MSNVAVICKPNNEKQPRSFYRILGLPTSTTVKGAKPTMKHVGGIEDVTLPVLVFNEGVNWVDDEQLKSAIATNPLVKRLLDKNVLDIRRPVAEVPNNLITDYSDIDREDIIKESNDEIKLKEWIAQNPGTNIEKWARERLSEIEEDRKGMNANG